MGKPLDPGPPLTAADEFCACEAPGTATYVKAVGIALLISMIGAVAWGGVAVMFGKVLAFPTMLVALAAGWSVQAVAGRHRSLALGIIAAVATLMAVSAGYLLLGLPQIHRPATGWPLNWYDYIMAGVAAFVAFRVTGQSTKTRKSL